VKSLLIVRYMLVLKFLEYDFSFDVEYIVLNLNESFEAFYQYDSINSHYISSILYHLIL
jgi:hypothetical protein